VEKLSDLLKSRKFWAAVVGLAVALFGERAGVTADQLTLAIVVLASYILGTAIEDALARVG
jgi:hypothetical protein